MTLPPPPSPPSPWPTGRSFAEKWFPAFITWARTRGRELTEIASDCAREELFNSYAAWHMRDFARGAAPLFWARCEWDHIDITFGVAPARFAAWERAWANQQEGELGIVEAKLIYEHTNNAGVQLVCAGDQLRARLTKYGARLGTMLALVYWYSEDGNAPALANELRTAGLAPIAGGFQEVGRVPLLEVWPLTSAGAGRLYFGLFELDQAP